MKKRTGDASTAQGWLHFLERRALLRHTYYDQLNRNPDFVDALTALLHSPDVAGWLGDSSPQPPAGLDAFCRSWHLPSGSWGSFDLQGALSSMYRGGAAFLAVRPRASLRLAPELTRP